MQTEHHRLVAAKRRRVSEPNREKERVMMQRGCQHGLERAALRTCTRNARPITHFSLVSTSIREHTARSCDVRSATSDEPRKMSNSGASGSGRTRGIDVVLSSGWLGFALHAGVLQAVEEAEGVGVKSVMGTSSGAFAGSLYCAGYSPIELSREISRVPPIKLLRTHMRPWEGFFLLDGVVERLRELLPSTFEELEKPLTLGVVDREGRHILLDKGPLPEAVAASACVPAVFRAVSIPGLSAPCIDGGIADRVSVAPFRQKRRAQLGDGVPPALVHVISRSSPFSGFDDVPALNEPAIHIVSSSKVSLTEANLWDLGDFSGMMERARARAAPVVARAAADAASGAGGAVSPAMMGQGHLTLP